MTVPSEQEWRDITQKFEHRWNFPNCIGAIDGKHVVIQAPANSGSLYYNYKCTFSLVLMALVDAEVRFIAIDVGSYGCNSDGGIFSNSAMGRAVQSNKFNIPAPTPLPEAAQLGHLPYVIVGDEAFPSKTYLFRPYPGGI